jgi:hypothetical protein
MSSGGAACNTHCPRPPVRTAKGSESATWGSCSDSGGSDESVISRSESDLIAGDHKLQRPRLRIHEQLRVAVAGSPMLFDVGQELAYAGGHEGCAGWPQAIQEHRVPFQLFPLHPTAFGRKAQMPSARFPALHDPANTTMRTSSWGLGFRRSSDVARRWTSSCGVPAAETS